MASSEQATILVNLIRPRLNTLKPKVQLRTSISPPCDSPLRATERASRNSNKVPAGASIDLPWPISPVFLMQRLKPPEISAACALISHRNLALPGLPGTRLESALVFLQEANTICCGQRSDPLNHAMPKMRKP